MTTTAHSGSGDISKSLALMWELEEKPTRGPKPTLTLDRIVGAAIEIADAEGLEALSMRRVAESLGVGTMSLYRYVPGKAELLDLMLDSVSKPSHSELGPDWRDALEALGRGLWRLYTTHTWLPFVDQSRPLLGPNALDGFEVILGGMVDMDLSDREKVNVIGVVDAFVSSVARTHNSAVMAEQRTGVSSDDFWAAQVPVLEKAMGSERYPRIARLADDAFAATGEELFETGLRFILDGVGDLLVRRAASRS